MRWVIAMAAGVCAGIALVAAVHGLNKAGDWHAHREVVSAHLSMLEKDAGYPDRESNIRSERARLEALDYEVRRGLLLSAVTLFLDISASVPLWRRARPSFTTVRLTALVAITAVAFLSGLGLMIVMLSAGVMRG